MNHTTMCARTQLIALPTMAVVDGPDRGAGPRIRRVVVGALGTNCWIVAARHGDQAVVIDPGDEAETIRRATAGLDVTAVLLTHTHWDHVLAVPDPATELWSGEARSVRHGQQIPVGDDTITVLHTPGHTPGGSA